MKGRTGKAKTKAKTKRRYASGGEVSPFGKAFRAARSAGDKEFTFGGKRYNTKLKEEVASRAGRTTPTPPSPATVQAAAPAPKPPMPAEFASRAPAVGKAAQARRAAADAAYGPPATPKPAPPPPPKAAPPPPPKATSAPTPPEIKGRAPAVGKAAIAARAARDKEAGYRKGGAVKRRKKYI